MNFSFRYILILIVCFSCHRKAVLESNDQVDTDNYQISPEGENNYDTYYDIGDWYEFFFFKKLKKKIVEIDSSTYYYSYDEFHFEEKLEKNKSILYLKDSCSQEQLDDVMAIDTYNKQYLGVDDFTDGVLRDLLFHPFYKHPLNNVVVPESLAKFVELIFDDVKGTIKNEKLIYSKIRDTKLKIDSGDVPLDLYADLMDNTVYVSPAIIRAFYYLAASDYMSDIKEIPEGEEDGVYDVKLMYLSLFYTRFYSSLAFMFHHEMAHLYLSKSGEIVLNEELCDCYAINLYRRTVEKNTYVAWETNGDLDTWDKIMSKVIENNDQKLWGIENPKDIQRRIENIYNENFPKMKDCLNKYPLY